jgi:hypothetical protein
MECAINITPIQNKKEEEEEDATGKQLYMWLRKKL